MLDKIALIILNGSVKNYRNKTPIVNAKLESL